MTCTYFAKNHNTGLTKVGRSETPFRRALNLGSNVEVLLWLPFDCELHLHDVLSRYRERIGVEREWFRLTPATMGLAIEFAVRHQELFLVTEPNQLPEAISALLREFHERIRLPLPQDAQKSA